jgi:hypothetical protein
MSVFCQIRGQDIEKITFFMTHLRWIECHCDRSSTSLNIRHDSLVTSSTTPGDNITGIERNIGVALNIALCLDRGGKIIITLESQVMNKPYTKCQQESKQKNCKISPADIQ